MFATPTRSLWEESIRIHPENSFQTTANVRSIDLFEEAKQDPLLFWETQAHHFLDWDKKWETVLDWQPPYANWFLGGKLNACYNCVDRHIKAGKKDKVAFFWEGENGEEKVWTYEELFEAVNAFSLGLKSLGVQKNDRIAIYMPMIPEAVIAMLSAARIGAIHTVIFGGFSAEALKERILDAGAKILITADGGWRKGKVVALKESADRAVSECPTIEKVVVVERIKQPISWIQERDVWYHELIAAHPSYCPPEPMAAEDPLFILYTSGTTGKPKGIVHSTGGYLLGATATTHWVFDLKPEDVFWCTADVGWITGHSYVVYGPLANGATQIIYEGSPDFPSKDRYWKLIEKYRASILYTAPTAIRTFMKWGEEWVKKCDISSLRLLGSVGEPINPQAWLWYYTHIGQGKCPIVDTWWQTETGSIMIAPLPALTGLKPGSATHPLPGLDIAILNDEGERVSSGLLAITAPWPSMLKGLYNDHARYEETYWKKWKDRAYFSGDGAVKDEEGYFWLMGRVDDVINVSGHRIGTMEVESAFVDHSSVAESAVIGIEHEIKGQAIAGFIVLKEGVMPSEELLETLKSHVVRKIGAIARPDKIIFICDLPKTRSGKIMRRLLRDIAEGRILGDVTTLSDPAILGEIKHRYDENDA